MLIFFLTYKSKCIAILNTHLQILKWKIQNKETNLQINSKPNTLKWTRDISDLVLLIYGAVDTSIFNNGQVDIKEVANFVGAMLGIEIKDYSNIFRQIRKRKIKERTAFLDEMRIKLIQRMDDADNGIYKCSKKRK